MKRTCVFLCLAALTAAFAINTDLIPQEKIASVANRLIGQKFGTDFRLNDVLPYYSVFDGSPNAYAYIYKNNAGDPVTIVMGARYTSTPVGEITRGMPRAKTNQDKALNAARQILTAEPVMSKAYYWGPGEEYLGFRSGDQEVLINLYTYQKFNGDITKVIPNPELERLTRDKWEKYLSITDYTTRQGNYVDSVPWIDWVYGCSPTAASMMFGYWDARGYGRLIDYYFTHWDYPEGEWNDCANVNRELAIAMYTDTMTGGTSIGNIRNGMINVANSIHGHSFSASTSPQGQSYNQYVFSWIKTEIDAQRPCHWSILYYWYGGQYINHSVTGVGYDIILPDTFVQIHTTWDNGEPLWPLWTYYSGTYSYDYVVTLIPGGATANNIFVTRPVGGDLYALPTVFGGIKYNILWNYTGTTIDHCKMWYSHGENAHSYDSLNWNVITSNAANTGKYTWTCPTTVCSLRVNMSALSAANARIAADGMVGRCLVKNPSHSAEVTLAGHYDTGGWAYDAALAGSYVYVADGVSGLTVIDVSDSSLPDYYSGLALPGLSNCIAISGQYAYVGDREDTLRVVSIANPLNPVQVGKCSIADDVRDVYVSGSYVYVAARNQGLVIVNVTTPSNPQIVGTLDTDGMAYDVCVDGNYAYVADATTGVKVIDISNPASPVLTGYNNTAGVANGVCKSGSRVYVADGATGIKVFDASSPDTLILLGSLDTPGSATRVSYWNNLLFVADGTNGGLRVINVTSPTSPVEAGYMQGYSAGGNLVVDGNKVYLADGSIGLVVILQTITGVEEHNVQLPPQAVSMNIGPNPLKLRQPAVISLVLNRASQSSIQLLDCSGRHVADIFNGVLNRGENRIHWQGGNDIAAGVYFVEQHTGSISTIRKLVLVK
ncbi:MAG TPA: hypothetical protein VF399_03730 [bacterium]